eukprot:Selendium_serpulae@DN5464_c0_g1_i3.p1
MTRQRHMNILFFLPVLSLAARDIQMDDTLLPECDLPWDHAAPRTDCVPKVVLNCGPGQVLAGAKCLQTLVAEEILTCPPHAKLVGRECISSYGITPDIVCPPGFQLSRGKRPVCERLEVIPARPHCDDGFHVSHGLCSKKHVGKPHMKCPSKYRMSHHKMNCLKEVVSRPQQVCPHGFSFSAHGKGKKGEDCVKVVTVPADVGCPKDYFMHENGCLKLDKIKIHKSCPKGFTQEGHFCIQSLQAKAELDCPAGYHLKGAHICEAVVTAQAFPVCPKHYDMGDGGCEKEMKHAPAMICPKGAVLSGGECVSKLYAPNELVCPPGAWLKSGKYCVTTEQIPSELKCPFLYHQEGDNCVKSDKKPHKMTCPKSFGLDGGKDMCVRVHKYKAETKCDGHKSFGHKCEAIEEVPADQICRKGEINHFGECVSKHSKDPEGFCPKGFMAAPGKPGLCRRVIVSAMEMVCPPGTEFKHGKCALCTTHPAELSCPKKFQISSDGGCTRSIKGAPTMECPPGFVIDGAMCFPAVGEKHVKKGNNDKMFGKKLGGKK